MGRIIIYFLAIPLLLSSCNWIFRNEELTFKREEYRGNKLRMDGYYYKGNQYAVSTYFLYKNGIILYTWSTSADKTLTEIENRFVQQDFLEKLQTVKTLWGLYNIKGDSIAFELLYPHPYKAYIRSGHILNDTTFVITQSMRPDGTEVSKENEVYHFKQFSPKPDSVSKFIE